MALTVSMLAARPPHGTAGRDLWPRCVHPWPGERQRRAIGIRSSGRIRSHVAHPVPVFPVRGGHLFRLRVLRQWRRVGRPPVRAGRHRDGHRARRLRHRAAGKRRDLHGRRVRRYPEQKDIGVGAAMGGPLVLATLAYAVVGLALWRAHRGRATQLDCINADQRRQARDRPGSWASSSSRSGWGCWPSPGSPGWASCSVTYGLYVKRELSNDEESLASEDLEPLKLRPATRIPRCPGPSRRRCWRWW